MSRKFGLNSFAKFDSFSSKLLESSKLSSHNFHVEIPLRFYLTRSFHDKTNQLAVSYHSTIDGLKYQATVPGGGMLIPLKTN